MFAESLLEMQSGRAPGWMRLRSFLVAFACQVVVLAGALVVPLVWPAPMPAVQALAAVPRLRPPHVVVQLVRERPKPAPRMPASMPTPALAKAVRVLEAPHKGGMLQRAPAFSPGEQPGLVALGGGMQTTFSFGSGPGAASGIGGAVMPAVRENSTAARSSGPARVSEGVTQGHLLAPIRPVYPPMAISIRTAGTVVITASIDTGGRITRLAVASGPDLLRTAAIKAVREARYRPFLLNGQPTEVQTTITVHFSLGDS